MELTYWILLVLAYIHIISGSECVFPLEWRGRWYEGRRTEISINSFSRKGTCIQNEGDKYFMLNKDSRNKKCFKCLVFTQWHPNLLQYKESPCWYEESFQYVCSLINADAVLNTVVRAPSTPQPCPFQGSYTFSYTNGTMSNRPCDSPISEVRACADESKFKFIYKRCAGVPGTYDTAMDFQCLATWDNGEKFLYGSFSQPWMGSLDQYKFRCFMHSYYGTNGDMSMSADSSCQGLQSPTLGVISMKFTKDMNEPRGRCRFPDVLVNRNKWRDLSGNWQLEVESGLQVLKWKSRSSKDTIKYSDDMTYTGDLSSTKLVIRCVDKTYSAESKLADVLQTDYITFVTDDSCESGYQCVRLIKRDTNILELYLGDRINNTDYSCDEKQFRQATKHLLIPDVNDSGQCSITRKGIYSYQDKASECTGTVNIGCTTPNKIIVDTSCPSHHKSPREHTEKVEIHNCLHSWTTGSKTYIIIQNEGERAKCLTFIDTEFGVELQSDDSCQSDRWTVTNQYLNYLLYSPPEQCVSKEIQADQNTDSNETDNDTVINDRHYDPNSSARTTFLAPVLVLSVAVSLLVNNLLRPR